MTLLVPSLRPAVSVATVVARDGAYLLVEEETRAGLRLNQPAGHLESGETPAEGAVRETLEESAWRVEVTHLIGIYLWRPLDSEKAYLRFAFAAVAREHFVARPLDTGIVRALWMTEAEIRAQAARHRSPLVMRCIDDYVAGHRLPLDAIVQVASSV
ncbi:MAG: NUDIX hydrolase [Casimicrobiaceae bacterium]